MKKTIFLLALVLPVCSLVAQPDIGDLPLEDVNLSVIVQVENSNSAVVTQDGLNNYSFIHSLNGDNLGNIVDQDGGTNYSYIMQNKGNSAVVTQLSRQSIEHNINLSWIDQSGEGNGATVVQQHNGGTAGPAPVVLEAYIDQSGDDNIATQIQGPAPGQEAEGLYATINQSGSLNEAFQKQKKDGNYANTIQEGDNNKAEQYQDLGAEGTVASNNVAFIWQDGNNNQTAIQSQNGDDNWAIALVPGDGNSSYQEQGKGGTETAERNVAVVYQDGVGNDAVQKQYGYENIAASGQWGDINESKQYQKGTQNIAISVQTGNGTLADVQTSSQDQEGERNVALILQNGNTGDATQVQVNDGTPMLPPNVALIIQTGGDNNSAYQSQTIGDPFVIPNLAGAYQEGSDNFSSQFQVGGSNISGVYQNGDSNSADVTQTSNVIFPTP